MQMTCNKISVVFGFKLPSFSFLIFALFFASCERGTVETSEDPVSWPEINRFDDIAFRADGYARVEDLTAVRELMADLLLAGKALTKDTIPANAADPQQVELILGDLSNLVSGLAAEE